MSPVAARVLVVLMAHGASRTAAIARLTHAGHPGWKVESSVLGRRAVAGSALVSSVGALVSKMDKAGLVNKPPKEDKDKDRSLYLARLNMNGIARGVELGLFTDKALAVNPDAGGDKIKGGRRLLTKTAQRILDMMEAGDETCLSFPAIIKGKASAA